MFTEESVKSKYNDIVKQKCEIDHSEYRCSLLVVTDSRDEFTKDGDKIMKIFKDKAVNFGTIKDTSTVNCNSIIAIIEAVTNFAYFQYYKFFASITLVMEVMIFLVMTVIPMVDIVCILILVIRKSI